MTFGLRRAMVLG